MREREKREEIISTIMWQRYLIIVFNESDWIRSRCVSSSTSLAVFASLCTAALAAFMHPDEKKKHFILMRYEGEKNAAAHRVPVVLFFLPPNSNRAKLYVYCKRAEAPRWVHEIERATEIWKKCLENCKPIDTFKAIKRLIEIRAVWFVYKWLLLAECVHILNCITLIISQLNVQTKLGFNIVPIPIAVGSDCKRFFVYFSGVLFFFAECADKCELYWKSGQITVNCIFIVFEVVFAPRLRLLNLTQTNALAHSKYQ